MEPVSETHDELIYLTAEFVAERSGHPWLVAGSFHDLPTGIVAPVSATVHTSTGDLLGSGVYDPKDAVAAWRRFSWQADVLFDSAYLVDAIHAALERRSDEACQRLIASDADYLPGLTVDIFGDVLRVQAKSAAVVAHLVTICDVFTELVAPREIVVDELGTLRTQSGNNLKGFWIDVDGLQYRIDLLNPAKPVFYLDQREQHALVGSLCHDRRVLDGFAGQGGFALQAAQAGARAVVAVDLSDKAAKTLGANAQKNGFSVQAVEADLLSYLEGAEASAFDAVILDPPEAYSFENFEKLLMEVFRVLAQGGLLAVYSRGMEVSQESFERLISRAASAQGREGRIFAKTGQPFDFPSLLSLPESVVLKGLILQVE